MGKSKSNLSFWCREHKRESCLCYKIEEAASLTEKKERKYLDTSAQLGRPFVSGLVRKWLKGTCNLGKMLKGQIKPEHDQA